jgi:hypothetical protein
MVMEIEATAPQPRRWRPSGEAAPCPFFFLRLGAGMEVVLPRLDGFQGEVFSLQWMGAWKIGFPRLYIDFGDKSWPWD